MTAEKEILNQVMLRATQYGARLFRNNCGRVQDITGTWIAFGVGRPGGSDLIGWTPDGRFLAVEVKYGKTRTTEAQENFVQAVRDAGGVGGIVHSVDHFDLLMMEHDYMIG